MKEYTVRVYKNGSKCWYLGDNLHREDGPAIEWADGDKSWYLDGERVTEEEHKRRTADVDDARLIAAAPEMLEALEKMVELNAPGRVYELHQLGMLVYTMLSIARAAIAKAKGEEHKRRTGGTTMEDARARLVRIMGTFDLATGHADTMDQALDALEEELRDVLGHLRARRVAKGGE